MTRKSIVLLTILFAVFLALSFSGNSPSTQNQSFKPKTANTPKPNLLPLDFKTDIQAVKNFISPTPRPVSTHSLANKSASKSFESLKELQNSLNISLDLTSGGSPFGGKVTYLTGCDNYCGPLFCGLAYELISVGPPVGGSFTLTYGTSVYREFDESVGNWVLGLTTGNSETCWQCIVTFEGPICVPIGGGEEINIMGTSN